MTPSEPNSAVEPSREAPAPDASSPPRSTQRQRIRPPKGWAAIDFAELWRYRELLVFLVWRDVKVKYKQTALGLAWAIIVPFFQMIVFAVLFGRFGRLSTNGLPGPVYYFAGLLPWSYFAMSLSLSADSLIRGAPFLTKIYFPRLLIPAAPCLASLIDFFIAFVFFLLIMTWYGVMPPMAALLTPLLLAMTFLTAFAAGSILSALYVKYRDIRYAIPFIIQLWMYATVIVPFSEVSRLLRGWGPWRYLYGLNPMAGVVETFRWAMLHPHMSLERATETPLAVGAVLPETLEAGQRIVVRAAEDGRARAFLVQTQSVAPEAPWPLLAIGVAVLAVLLVFSLYYFKRLERQFADIV